MEKLLKQVKKKNKKLYSELHIQQSKIKNDPLIGDKLKGDLKELRSHDFKFHQVDLRVCYAYYEEDQHVKFVYFGTRENFYRDVKRYIY